MRVGLAEQSQDLEAVSGTPPYACAHLGTRRLGNAADAALELGQDREVGVHPKRPRGAATQKRRARERASLGGVAEGLEVGRIARDLEPRPDLTGRADRAAAHDQRRRRPEPGP